MKIKATKIRFLIIAALLFILPSFCLAGDNERDKEIYLKEIDTVRELIKKSPEDPVLHNKLGYYFFKTGDYEHAKEEYAKAIEYDEKYSTPYNNLGVIALLNNDYDEAETYFTGAIERDPKYTKAVYNLGVTYFRQKKYIKAVRYYMKAKEVDEEYVNEREDFEKSDKELKEALEKDPDNEVLKYLLKKSKERHKD